MQCDYNVGMHCKEGQKLNNWVKQSQFKMSRSAGS